ncbi:MAG: transcriptional repressor [Candidatus Omnitrophica bacterium]|nr:transcriptional repressor [Candidatus Omnitrophota bacterium]MCM8825478.1 transcriptional repressor [Candidatus Omnitrophota bacterium]
MREEGMRMTQARAIILNIFAGNQGEHFSAQEIFFIAHRINPGIGFATVYRTLDLLAQMGIIQKLEFGDGLTRYEMTEAMENVPHHHHLVCTECGKVIDYTEFTDEEKELFAKVEKELSEKYKFKIKNHIIQFCGICNNCGERR